MRKVFSVNDSYFSSHTILLLTNLVGEFIFLMNQPQSKETFSSAIFCTWIERLFGVGRGIIEIGKVLHN